MAKRKHRQNEEMLLVPFLDILCSLIGVLVLIIVFLTISQTTKTEGRTREEIEMATEYKKLSKELLEQKALAEKVKPMLDRLKILEEEEKDKSEKSARLRKLLSQATDAKALSQNMLKELDNLLLEISGYDQQSKDLKKEIETLAAEIKQRKLIASTPAPVIVRPAGAGMARDSKNFFIEASGGKIVLYWDEQRRTQVSSQPEVIIADPSYQAFLTKVKEDPKGKIVFLVREDGLGSYNNAAGWAQQTHGFAPAQVAKLPIPGRGAIDLKMFRDFFGTISPPSEAPLLPPPAANP